MGCAKKELLQQIRTNGGKLRLNQPISCTYPECPISFWGGSAGVVNAQLVNRTMTACVQENKKSQG
jgi:hypothetical protein